MPALTLEHARTIVETALRTAQEKKLKPLAVAVLDAGGALKAFERQDGSSLMRSEIAQGKARGAIALGMGSCAIFERAQEQPYFVASLNTMAHGSLVPVPGGVLMRDEGGEIVGAVGITGDTSDNDEACAIAGIEAVGFVADPG